MKGSKKHILSLIDDKEFIEKMNTLLVGTNTILENKNSIFPKSFDIPNEKTLSTFLRDVWKNKELGNEFTRWWIEFGSRTPQWDIISKCKINGTDGILLVEAKAHKSEITGDKGKKIENEPKKIKNHNHIKAAINKANESINELNDSANLKLNIDVCYQLSNRVASTWWLASHNIPVTLIYLGFLNDNYFKDKFQSDKDWQNCFEKHTKTVGVQTILNNHIKTKNEYFNFISKSIDINDLM